MASAIPNCPSVIEFTTCFHQFSKYETTNFFNNIGISSWKKQTIPYWSKKGIFPQFWTFGKIRTNFTYLVEKICRFILIKFVKTCHELDHWRVDFVVNHCIYGNRYAVFSKDLLGRYIKRYGPQVTYHNLNILEKLIKLFVWNQFLSLKNYISII